MKIKNKKIFVLVCSMVILLVLSTLMIVAAEAQKRNLHLW